LFFNAKALIIFVISAFFLLTLVEVGIPYST